MTELVELLQEHERVWRERPLLRRLYHDWFRLLTSRLANVGGPVVELGCGTAHFREVRPDVVETDIVQTPWTDAVVDATSLPYADESVGNLVLLDVFHHIASVSRFLDEADRVLVPGGRVVILDPYCSPASAVAYSRFHQEEVRLDVDPLADDAAVAEGPMHSNLARTTLVFFRDLERFASRWPRLVLVHRRRLAFVLYPLTGGFSRRQLVPAVAYRPLTLLESILRPLGQLLAFRCLVVLQRAPREGSLEAHRCHLQLREADE